jgi:tRNA(fMet)-specific endonuclease VapC
MKFLLDTDTCIYALKQRASVLQHLLARSPEDIAVSVITEAELRTGAAKSASPAKTLRLVDNFLHPLTILEFTSSDAASYAQTRACANKSETRTRRETHWSARHLDRVSGGHPQTGPRLE